MKCIDLFCGAGGSALGFHQAGLELEHVLLIDSDKDACNTIKLNKPAWNTVCQDISLFNFKPYKNIDIVFAGFPCQPFSYAGQREGFKDKRGSLFFEVIRCLKETNSRAVVLENVKGLLRHNKGETLRIILNELNLIGYKNVSFKILNAVDYGVAQKRERLFIVAFKDPNIKFQFPIEITKNNPPTLQNVLQNVPISEGAVYNEKKANVLKLISEGCNWRSLQTNIQKEYMGKMFYSVGGKTGIARRLSWNQPSLTILTSPIQKQTERCHPTEVRPLSIRESARIQSFPDSWKFVGSLMSQYRQIGNAVPVGLAKCLAISLKNTL
jgi:DNA (cytosine-5)-methyltransferase 1